MADQLTEIRKSIDGVSRALSSIRAAPGGARQRVDVDALTDAEVDELEALATCEDAAERSQGRIAQSEALEGMYAELAALGLVDVDSGGTVIGVRPVGLWAVEKRRQRTAEREADVARQLAHDRKMTLISAMAGLVGAIVGSPLTVLLPIWLSLQ